MLDNWVQHFGTRNNFEYEDEEERIREWKKDQDVISQLGYVEEKFKELVAKNQIPQPATQINYGN